MYYVTYYIIDIHPCAKYGMPMSKDMKSEKWLCSVKQGATKIAYELCPIYVKLHSKFQTNPCCAVGAEIFVSIIIDGQNDSWMEKVIPIYQPIDEQGCKKTLFKFLKANIKQYELLLKTLSVFDKMNNV